MRISIIIPIYDPEGKNEALTAACLNSIIKNSSKHEYEIIPIYHTDLNYSTAVNKGFGIAKGDYFIICSNDVEIRDNKWIDKYISRPGISSWRTHEFYMTGKQVPDASCWGMHRKTFELVGYLDEIYKDGYGYEDSDYWMRCIVKDVPFNSVQAKVFHHETKTFKTYFASKKEMMTETNKILFIHKWEKQIYG